MDGYTLTAIIIACFTLEECVRAIAGAWAKKKGNAK